MVWHRLDPWADSSPGIHKLGTKFITSTLPNGNQSLLRDLDKHGDLGFKKIQSAADFKAYKRHPSVYKGAANVMGLRPEDVAMLAAHLSDLKAARSCGFKTIYVVRKQEEDWKPGQEEYEDAKTVRLTESLGSFSVFYLISSRVLHLLDMFVSTNRMTLCFQTIFEDKITDSL